ncbi:MBL fold metallo-hydrolase [Pseudonocardia spinosispora]|uniref:MBL fold metallo-hydrolase n=1 Tax=Pseudonocardia spinosispora TaxID=103441 RepID=UPI00040ED9F6|nr:MBL fold metallo-hydrolase [Pseudonocardia spinosispora]
MKIGSIEILPVLDGVGRENAHEVLSRPGVDDAWSCHSDQLDEHGVLHLDLGGFLVRTGDRVVLVDAGVGTIDNGQYSGGKFLRSLAARGVTPEDVTDVVFTHLHFDHVGWATSKGQVVFPHATYRVHAADWAHFVEAPDAQPGAVRKLGPLRSRLETFDTDVSIAPGLTARHTPGHTPGSTVYIVADGDQRALLLGDVVHSVVELHERDWEAVFDLDPVAARAMRNVIADEVADSADLVVGAHFPGLRFGRVVTASGTRRFQHLV